MLLTYSAIILLTFTCCLLLPSLLCCTFYYFCHYKFISLIFDVHLFQFWKLISHVAGAYICSSQHKIFWNANSIRSMLKDVVMQHQQLLFLLWLLLLGAILWGSCNLLIAHACCYCCSVINTKRDYQLASCSKHARFMMLKQKKKQRCTTKFALSILEQKLIFNLKIKN